MLHINHYHNKCDRNFCYSKTLLHNHRRQQKQKTELCVKNPVFYQIDKKMTITSFISQLKLNTVLPEVQDIFYFHHTSF